MNLDYLFVNQKIEFLQGEYSALLRDKNKALLFYVYPLNLHNLTKRFTIEFLEYMACAKERKRERERERERNYIYMYTYLPTYTHAYINICIFILPYMCITILAFIGWETKNRYTITNLDRETIFYVAEESGTCERLCLSSYRPCEFYVFDKNRQEIFRMIRPFRCDSCCCPCYLQVIFRFLYSFYILCISVQTISKAKEETRTKD